MWIAPKCLKNETLSIEASYQHVICTPVTCGVSSGSISYCPPPPHPPGPAPGPATSIPPRLPFPTLVPTSSPRQSVLPRFPLFPICISSSSWSSGSNFCFASPRSQAGRGDSPVCTVGSGPYPQIYLHQLDVRRGGGCCLTVSDGNSKLPPDPLFFSLKK